MPGWQDGQVLDDASPGAAPPLDLSQSRGIQRNGKGGYQDASGATYTAAPDLGAGYFRDAQGRDYRDTSYAPAQTWDSAPVIPGSDVVPPPAPKGPGAITDLATGAVKGITGLPDLLAGAYNAGPNSVDNVLWRQVLAADPAFAAAAKARGIDPEAAADEAVRRQFSSQYWMDKGIGVIPGLTNPESVPAPTAGDRILQAVGAGAVTAPLGGEATIANLARSAVVGGVAGAASQAAAEAAPAPVKPLVALPAGALAALVTHGVLKLPQQTAAAAAPFAANVSTGAAEGQAGARLAAAASDLPQLRASVAEGPTELVPGSAPTLAEQSGDTGIARLERRVAAKNPDPFVQRQADQNAARVAALSGVQSGGDPAAVSGFLRGQLDAIDSQADQAVQSAMSEAQAKAGAIGGTGAPEDYGAGIRGALQDAEDAARAQERALWRAVDPNGTLKGNATETIGAARDILSGMPQTAKPLEGEEAAIFQTAAHMKPLTPISDLIALRQRVSTAMREELTTSGRSPAYARLSQ